MDPSSTQPDASTQNQRTDEITVESGALSLPIDPIDLVQGIQAKIDEAEKYYKNKFKLDSRRDKLRDFWKGIHYEDESKFEEWQIPYKDNVMHQDLETRISIASSRLPDIIVTPSDDTNEALESSKEVQKALEVKIKNRITKRMIKRGLRHNQLDFIGVIKFRWDPNLNNGTGDFVYELVRPDRILLDHTATIPDNGFTADNMQVIAEWIEEPFELVLSKFPDKADKLNEMTKNGTKGIDKVGKLKYREVWFEWFDKTGKVYNGVAWLYKDELLDAIKNPYYDWDGYERVIVSQNEDGRYNPKPEKETAFYNYFDRPRAPYIFFSYESLGESPLDETTIAEQVIPIQRQLNKRGRQISEISDKTVPKKIFAGKYITKEEARRVTDDPEEMIWLDKADDVNKAFTTTMAEPVAPALVEDQNILRGRIDAHFATHGTTRGETIPDGESGLSKQITREGDFTMSDDMVDVIVERVMFEIASWSLQMMKLFYDEAHYIRNLGTDGELVNIELKRESIKDGIGIDVESSSVDKQTRRSDAMNLASRKAIDPLTMFEDLEAPNPKERTRRLVAFLNSANDQFASYMAEIDVEMEHQNQQPQNLNPVTGQQNADANQAQKDIQTLVTGQQVTPPKSFDQTYVQTFVEFTQSGQFDQLNPNIQNNIRTFVEQLRSAAASMMNTGAVAPDLNPQQNPPVAPAP